MRFPHLKSPKIDYGLRATRYFLEFPMLEPNIDVFQMILSLEQMFSDDEKRSGCKITSKNSYKHGDNFSYMLDYSVDSTTAMGGKNKGTFYIRGVENSKGDAYKFVLEKNTDFHEFDIRLILKAYHESFKNSKRSEASPPAPVMGTGGETSKRGKSKGVGGFIGELTG
jgi:hypothetical protein